MKEFNRDMRMRVVRRYLAVALVVVGVTLLFGLLLGRPFASPTVIDVRALQTTGPAAASPTPTPTAAPSATLASTGTPAPLATFSPEAAWKILSQESFDRVTTWPATEEQGWSSGYEAGRYWLRLDGQRTLSYSVPIDEPEFRVAVDVQIESGHAGLLFLSEEPNIFYRFLIDGAGSFRLERQQAADTAALRDWTASDALRAGPDAINQLEVQRVGDEIILSANGTELMRYSLAAGGTLRGRAGMTLDAVARDTAARAYFDNLVVRVPLISAAQ